MMCGSSSDLATDREQPKPRPTFVIRRIHVSSQILGGFSVGRRSRSPEALRGFRSGHDRTRWHWLHPASEAPGRTCGYPGVRQKTLG